MNLDVGVLVSGSGYPVVIKTCKKIGCKQLVFCRGSCVSHYHRDRRNVYKTRTCRENNCNKRVWKGDVLCHAHYKASPTRNLCRYGNGACTQKSMRNNRCELHLEEQPIFCKEPDCNIPILTVKSHLCAAHYHKKRRVEKELERERENQSNSTDVGMDKK